MSLANRSDYYAEYNSILCEAMIEYDRAPEMADPAYAQPAPQPMAAPVAAPADDVDDLPF